ncbi:DUF1836 domain-containing protein [Evansella sp. AB-rgal1]|uniref:DUF1836 domain-containing protein n=1 Tax=Evansella sp. AB-rgal1 TaxID=3242696 RepID=UPI00359DCAAF
MEKMKELIETMGLETNIAIEDIPSIDLYMDQVIQLFENNCKNTKRNDDEKVLTKTMINNYAKGKLFFPIENKKYSKEHIILISLIYQMKGALSIGDIKKTLEPLNKNYVNENIDLESIYRSYLTLSESNTKKVQEDILDQHTEVENELGKLEGEDKDYIEQLLIITSLIQMSNLYRRVAERLVDSIVEEK